MLSAVWGRVSRILGPVNGLSNFYSSNFQPIHRILNSDHTYFSTGAITQLGLKKLPHICVGIFLVNSLNNLDKKITHIENEMAEQRKALSQRLEERQMQMILDHASSCLFIADTMNKHKKALSKRRIVDAVERPVHAKQRIKRVIVGAVAGLGIVIVHRVNTGKHLETLSDTITRTAVDSLLHTSK